MMGRPDAFMPSSSISQVLSYVAALRPQQLMELFGILEENLSILSRISSLYFCQPMTEGPECLATISTMACLINYPSPASERLQNEPSLSKALIAEAMRTTGRFPTLKYRLTQSLIPHFEKSSAKSGQYVHFV